ncbi:MAG: hypothetical protein ABL899_01445 [Nitrospira sp.]
MKPKKYIFKVFYIVILLSPLSVSHDVFADTIAPQSISSDQTWTLANSPYILKNDVQVNSGVTLNIEPGVVIKPNSISRAFYVSGSIVAHGTPDLNIYFTSFKDDSVAGDTNKDGLLTVPKSADWDKIYILGSGKVDFSYVVLRYAGMYAPSSGIANYGGTINISNSKFSNDNIGIYQDSGVTNITTTEFFNQNVGFYLQTGPVNISQSSFHNNDNVAIFSPLGRPVDARNNYWGDSSGPFHPITNPNGKGDKLKGVVAVNYIPWLNSDPLQTSATTTPPIGNSNIMFLPGIEASRLYKTGVIKCQINCEDQLWEPNANSDVKDLYMDSNGKSLDSDIYTRDVIDEAYISAIGPNIYKSFLAKLEEMKSVDHSIADYSAVPYDWRLSIDDILKGGTKTGNNISYIKDSVDPYIVSELRRLVANSDSGKVTIIAHSNGGLLAKALLQKLADTNDPLLSKIDKLILVAVPQIGTPAAITSLLHGYDQGIPVVLSESTVRDFGKNLPSAYNLLPNDEYFKSVKTPVVMFENSMQDWIVKYGATTTSQIDLHSFLADSYGRVSSDSKDTDTPDSLNSVLLSNAKIEQNILNKWIPPASLEVIDVAGWGIPTTVSGVKYFMDKGKIKMEVKTVIDGDGTVVTPSALYSSGSVNTKRYWVDLNNDKSKKKHSNILEVSELRSLIENIIKKQKPEILPNYISTSTPVVAVNDVRLIYVLHSPLTFDMYDDLGNHTGLSTTTGIVEENIKGTYFLKFGDVKYIFTETSTPIHIFMNGYATSTFTLNIDELTGDTPITSTTFKDVPVTPKTKVTMNVSGDIYTVSSMNIDKNSDGIIDISLSPKIGDVVQVDQTPPEFSASFSTSTKSVVLSAIDMSPTKVVRMNASDTATSATDSQSNISILRYTKYKDSPTKSRFVFNSIIRNGITSNLIPTTVQYIWTESAGLVSDLTTTVFINNVEKYVFSFSKSTNTTVIKDNTVNTVTTRQGFVTPLVKTEGNEVRVNY